MKTNIQSSITLTQSDIDNLLNEIRTRLKKQKLTEDQFHQFTSTVHTVLTSYQKEVPEDTEVQYHIRSWMGRLHITFFIPGKRLNPFTEGQTAHELDFIKKINSLLYKPLSDVNYFYATKTNIVIITLQNNTLDLHVLRSPMVLSAILGLLLGLACHQLPAHISKSLVDNLVSPILHLIIGMVSGIMGPVIFISLVTSITTLDSINELNSQGIRLFRRFFHIALFTTATALLTAIIFFPALGQNKVSLDLSMVVQLFLSIFPTNIFSPFVDNNFPQLAILGLLMGAALLIISKKNPVLPSLLIEVRDWLNEIMNLVLKTMVAVPFLSIFTITAKGQSGMIIDGWRYIVGTYLCILVCSLLKLAKVSFRCKVNPVWLLKKTGPLVGLIFTTGNEMTGIGKFKEISKEDFGIDPDFTSFWYPLNQALLSPSSPSAYILSCFMVAEMTGVPISLEFLLILSLLTMQLSMATPGLIPGITILFKSLGLPMSYIGLFSAYSVFIKNSAIAFCGFYRTLEELEAAYIMNHVDKAQLQENH